jgi:hypothetical protein
MAGASAQGISTSHKYVPGTGLLLDLVAMLIMHTDVHAKWTAGLPAGAPLASGARFSSRHCKGAPATPSPPLQMISTTTSPINCFTPVEYWQNSPNIRSAGQSYRSPGCRLESGGAENRLADIAVQNFNTLLSCVTTKCDACHLF